MDSPAFKQDLYFGQSVEYLTIKKLIAQFPIERFDIAILPRATRFYE
jgi:hypothetical protein